jgi:PhnB protein
MGLQEHLRWRKAIHPLADTFWGELFGMLTDKFDNHWLLSYHS